MLNGALRGCRISRMKLLGFSLLLSIPLLAQQSAGRGGAPPTPKNLKLLDAKTDILFVMRSFNEALGVQCTHCHVEGDFAAAHAHLRESLRLRRALGDRRGIIMAVNNLGLLAVAEGNFARAKELYARSYAYGQKYGDVSALIMVLQQQVHLASITEDFQFARDLNQRWLGLKRELAGSAID